MNQKREPFSLGRGIELSISEYNEPAIVNAGAYAVYACCQPVRIRVNQIRGDNATLSGVFFDP